MPTPCLLGAQLEMSFVDIPLLQQLVAFLHGWSAWAASPAHDSSEFAVKAAAGYRWVGHDAVHADARPESWTLLRESGVEGLQERVAKLTQRCASARGGSAPHMVARYTWPLRGWSAHPAVLAAAGASLCLRALVRVTARAHRRRRPDARRAVTSAERAFLDSMSRLAQGGGSGACEALEHLVGIFFADSGLANLL